MSDALISATQNLVQAFNNNTRAYIYNSGQHTSGTVAGGADPVQIAAGGANSGSTANTTGSGSGSGIGGRVVSISVVVGGTGTVKFYNSASTETLVDRNLLAVLENPSIGIHDVGTQFVEGLVMVVTGNISVNCTYSLG